MEGGAGKGSYPAVVTMPGHPDSSNRLDAQRATALVPRLPPSGTSATATPPIQGRRLDPSDHQSAFSRAIASEWFWLGMTIPCGEVVSIVAPSQRPSGKELADCRLPRGEKKPSN